MPSPYKLISDLSTLKVVSELRVTWATSVPILVFLGLSVLDLGPMYATDRRQTSDAHHRLMPPPYGGGGIIIIRKTGSMEMQIAHAELRRRRIFNNSINSCLNWDWIVDYAVFLLMRETSHLYSAEDYYESGA